MQAVNRKMEGFEGENIFIKEGLERLISAARLEAPSDIDIATIRSRQVREKGHFGFRRKAFRESVTEALVICRGLDVADKIIGNGGKNIRGELTEWAEHHGNIDIYFVCKESAEIMVCRAILEETKENSKTLAPNLVWCDLGVYKPAGNLVSGQSPKTLLDQLGHISLKKHDINRASDGIVCWPLSDYLVDRKRDTEAKPMNPTPHQRPKIEERLPRSLRLKAVFGGILVVCWAGMFCTLAALLAVGDSSLIIAFGAFALLGWIAMNAGPSAPADER